MQSTGGHAMTADHSGKRTAGRRNGQKARHLYGSRVAGPCGLCRGPDHDAGQPHPDQVQHAGGLVDLDIGGRERIGPAALGRGRPGTRRAALGPDPHQRRHRRPGGEGGRQDERPRRRGRGPDPARGQGGSRPPFRRGGRGVGAQARARRPDRDGRPRQHQQGRGRRLHGRTRRHVGALRARRCHRHRSQQRQQPEPFQRPPAPRRCHRPPAAGAVGARLGDLEVRHTRPQPAGGRADRRPLRGDAGGVRPRQDAHPYADRRQGVADPCQGRRDGRACHGDPAGSHGRQPPCACGRKSTSTTWPRSRSASGCS